jgi:C-terminal processing protease CtpA/Prc
MRRFIAAAISAAALAAAPETAPLPPVLAEVDRVVRESFWDANLKGVDWSGAVRRAADDLARAADGDARDRAYDRLLATLDDSHTFRLPAGALPARGWASSGLRIGREGEGYAVKGIIPGTPAERAGVVLGDRVLAIDRRPYGREKVNFRELFLALEGPAGSTVEIRWKPASGGEERSAHVLRAAEQPGDALVWRSARVIRRGGKAYGYARLWGLNAETALAVVDLLLDREEVERVHKDLAGWGGIEGFLLDVRANSGGYDPNILATFLRGRWSSGDYYRRDRTGRRLVPPAYKPLPVVLLVNSATASAAEGLALQVRAHGIGPIVGEKTAGMATGGAFSHRLADGSWLWISNSRIEDESGRSYEGEGITPDIQVPDRPPAAAGDEEAIVEAGLRALGSRKTEDGRR